MTAPPSSRSGGLTFLAVLNFVFGFWLIISMVGAFLFAYAQQHPEAVDNLKFTKDFQPDLQALPLWFLKTTLALLAVKAALLFTSGFGYLKQKRFLGRWIGSAYAVVSIGDSVLASVALPYGFHLRSAMGMIFPVATLILVNTVFKDELVR